jgi:hypothetical protein
MKNMSDDEVIEPQECDPESLGWLKVGQRSWELPDGSIYEFADNVKQVVYRMPSPRGGWSR